MTEHIISLLYKIKEFYIHSLVDYEHQCKLVEFIETIEYFSQEIEKLEGNIFFFLLSHNLVCFFENNPNKSVRETEYIQVIKIFKFGYLNRLSHNDKNEYIKNFDKFNRRAIDMFKEHFRHESRI